MANPTHHDLHHALAALRRGTGRLLDDFYDHIGRHHHAVSGDVYEPGRPPAEVAESEIGFEVSVELPGMDEKDIEISLEGERLIVSGEKRDEREVKRKNYHLTERSYGAFERTFWLSPELDRDKTKATYKNGVLTVTVPYKKGRKAAARKVPIAKAR